jgi:hypothetical protein
LDRTSYSEAVRLVLAMYAVSVALAQLEPASLRTYRDPQNRFQFTYPAEFGTTAPGADSGFRNRTTAIRFSGFSAGVHAGRIILGGEAVLTSESPQLDLQLPADSTTRSLWQVFPEPMARIIRNALPVLSPDTFCDAIGRERHLDPADQRSAGLTAKQRATIATGDAVAFEKEAAFDPAGPYRAFS